MLFIYNTVIFGTLSKQIRTNFSKPKEGFVRDGPIVIKFSRFSNKYHIFGVSNGSLDPIFQEFVRKKKHGQLLTWMPPHQNRLGDRYLQP